MLAGRVVAGQARKAPWRCPCGAGGASFGRGKGWHMATNMMIDLETLDTRPSAVVFQVGVLIFEDIVPENFRSNLILSEKLYHLDILDQIMAGRTVDTETVRWWNTQKRNAWERSDHDITDTSIMFMEIANECKRHDVRRVWANSPSFDCVMMRSLRESLKISWEFPSFRQDMDLRTLKQMFKMNGRESPMPKKETTHNALQDCRDQFQEAVHYLGDFNSMVEIIGKYETDQLIHAPAKDT